tara:strand:+ start:821 stop:1210 length:390 start_codon:yes stop_codon:yes gene_type:complete
MKKLNEFLNEGSTSDGQFLLDNGFELNVEHKSGGSRTIAGASPRSSKEDKYSHSKVPGFHIQFMDHWKWSGFYIIDDETKDMYYLNKRSSGSPTADVSTRKALESTVKLMTKGKLPKGNPGAIEKYWNS